MCGITGFSGIKGSSFNVDKMKLLFLHNQERGKDSIGFYTPEKGVFKELGKPEDQMVKSSFDLPASNLFIGHVRQASIGLATLANAHPFQYGNIVLLMNGTFHNYFTLAMEYDLVPRDYDVDTQVLAAIINKTQSKEVLSKINGGCAILYVNTNNNRLYCYRNLERPLFRGTIDGNMYISSIENSLKLIGCINVKPFKENYLYEIEDGKILGQCPVPVYKIPTTTYNASCQYDAVNKYAYKSFMICELPINVVSKHWLTPDRDMPEKKLRQGFSYKCVGQGTGCAVGELTIINDNKERVNCFKTSFNYKMPILGVGTHVFAIGNLTFKDGGRSFCSDGDLMVIIKKNENLGEFSVKNLVNNETANIGEHNIRFAHRTEKLEFESTKWLYEEAKEVASTSINNQIRLPLEGSDEESNNNTNVPEVDITKKLLAPVRRFRDQLEATYLSDSYEQHVNFCMDNMESVLSDLDEMSSIPEEAQIKIQCIETIIDYFKDNLGYYQDDIKVPNEK